MLQSLRKGAGSWVAKGLMLLLVLSFGLWGVGDYVLGGGANRNVATVGDIKITQPEFADAVRRDIQRMQQRFGGTFDAEMAKRFGVVDSTLNTLVDRALIDQEARRLGIRVTNDAVRSDITSSPAFRNSLGQFDRLAFEGFLRNSGYSEGNFVTLLRRELAREQLVGSLTAGADTAPAAMVDALYRYRQEKRVAEFIVLRDDAQPAPAEPTEEQLVAFHKDNAPSFTAPELREITWFTLTPAEFAGQAKVTDEEIKNEYDSRSASYSVPEKRAVEQVVYPTEAGAKAALEMLKSGITFAAMAERTLKLKAADISLGTVTKDDLPAALATPVFELPLNEVSAPIQSPLGWHLARVSKIEAGGTKPLADVREEIRQSLAIRHAADDLVKLSHQIEDKLASGATIEETATAFKLKTAKAIIDARGRDASGQPVPGLPPYQRFLAVVGDATEKVEPQLEPVEDGGYFLVRVDKIIPATLRPLADIRANVVASWKAEQRAKGSEKAAGELLDKLKAGGDLQALAGAIKLNVELSPPLSRGGQSAEPRLAPKLVADLFGAKPGAIVSGRTAGNDGYVVGKLLRIEAADPAQGDATARNNIAQGLAGSIADDILTTYRAEMEKRFGVSINRAAVDAAL